MAAVTQQHAARRRRKCGSPRVRRLTALIGPHVQLLGQLGDDQERPPALTLLGLEDVSEDVVPDVDDVLPFSAQQVTHDV